jgi:CRISPR type IV-associated protein Csf1
MYSAPEIITNAMRLHLPSVLSPAEGAIKHAEHDMVCALSGKVIKKGDPFVQVKPGKSFTDWQYLSGEANNGVLTVTPESAALFTGEFLKYQAVASAAVYSADEALLITTDAQRMDFLMNPPNPPFVAYIATTMGQHAAWRAPVTLDKNLIRIGFARRHLTIRMPVFEQALLLSGQVIDAYNKPILAHNETVKAKKDKKKPLDLRSPFQFLDRAIEDSSHGLIRSDIKKFMIENGMTKELAFFESLSEGELWALSIFVKKKQETPTRLPIAQKLLDKKTAKEAAREAA